jgi:hypothetical protein
MPFCRPFFAKFTELQWRHVCISNLLVLADLMLLTDFELVSVYIVNKNTYTAYITQITNPNAIKPYPKNDTTDWSNDAVFAGDHTSTSYAFSPSAASRPNTK